MPTSFYKDPFGVVHLAGGLLASDGPGGDATCGGDDNDFLIFELPNGYQPENVEAFLTAGTVDGVLIIPQGGITLDGMFVPGGTVVAAGLDSADPNTMSFDGITFRPPSAEAAASASSPPSIGSLEDLFDLFD